MYVKLRMEIISQCKKDIKELQEKKQDTSDIFKLLASTQFELRKELSKFTRNKI